MNEKRTGSGNPYPNGLRCNALSSWSLNEFGQRLYKISLNGGMTCPNRDGRLDTRGCIFCSAGGSGEFAEAPDLSITQQIETGISRLAHKKANAYIAYFQAYTNTYAPVSRLRKCFMEAISHPQVAVLSIATRPDCLPAEVLDLLEELNHIKPIWVELGLQTIHEDTARYIRRGYSLPVFDQAVLALHKRNLKVIVHVIIGLPGEDRTALLETICHINNLPADGIKLQLLHILKGTDLCNEFQSGRISVLSKEEYIDLLIAALEILRPDIVIHRLTGDGPADLLVAPLWSLKKRSVLNRLQQKMSLQDTWQGSKYGAIL